MTFEHPGWLWAVPAAVLAMGWVSPPSATPRPRGLLFGLRLAAAAALGLAAAGPMLPAAPPPPVRIVLLDRSGSMRGTPDPSSAEWTVGLPDVARRGAIAFADRPIWIVPIGAAGGGSEAPLPPAAGGTDLAAALAEAARAVPAGTPLQLVIRTDGRETHGEASTVAAALAADGVDLIFWVPPSPTGADAAVLDLSAPHRIAPGERTEATVTVRTDGPATLLLRDADSATTFARIEIPGGGLREVRLPLTPAGEGWLALEARIRLEGEDAVPENDARLLPVRVGGDRTVLVVTASGEPRPIERSLAAAPGIAVRRFVPGGGAPFPAGYDVVVLDDVPADRLSESLEGIAASVRTGGAGLLALGGPRGLGPGGYADTPIESVLPVRCRPDDLPDLSLVLVLDRSGSMAGGKLETAREAAARVLREELRPSDRVGIVVFDVTAVPLGEPGPVRAVRDRLLADLARQRSGGNTRIHPAVRRGLEMLRGELAAKRMMLLLSDGIPESDEDLRVEFEEARRLAAEIAGEEIHVAAIAIQPELTGTARELLGILAGDPSRLHHVPRIEDLPDRFVGEVQRARTEEMIRRGRTEPRATEHLPGTFPADLPAVIAYARTGARDEAPPWVTGVDGEPLLAEWRIGAGRAAVFAGSFDDAWAPDWLAWGGQESFWTGWIARLAPAPEDARVSPRREADGVRLDLELPDGHPWREDPPVRLLVEGVASGRSGDGTWTGELVPAAPGSFTGLLSDGEGGTGILRIRIAAPSGEGSVLSTLCALPLDPEFLDAGPDRGRIAALARAAGGSVVETAADLPAPPAGPAVPRPATWVAVLLAFLFLATDMGIRAVLRHRDRPA